MYQKTETIENPYSKKDIKELKKLFAILEKARNDPKINAYTRRLEKKLKA